MIDFETVEDGTRALGNAIRRLLDDALSTPMDLPQNGFQQRMRFAGVVEVGRDVSALALAAIVLLRRSRQDLERP